MFYSLIFIKKCSVKSMKPWTHPMYTFCDTTELHLLVLCFVSARLFYNIWPINRDKKCNDDFLTLVYNFLSLIDGTRPGSTPVSSVINWSINVNVHYSLLLLLFFTCKKITTQWTLAWVFYTCYDEKHSKNL